MANEDIEGHKGPLYYTFDASPSFTWSTWPCSVPPLNTAEHHSLRKQGSQHLIEHLGIASSLCLQTPISCPMLRKPSITCFSRARLLGILSSMDISDVVSPRMPWCCIRKCKTMKNRMKKRKQMRKWKEMEKEASFFPNCSFMVNETQTSREHSSYWLSMQLGFMLGLSPCFIEGFLCG